MRVRLLIIAFVLSLNSLSFADDISDILTKEKTRLENSIEESSINEASESVKETTKKIEETTKAKETAKKVDETIKAQNVEEETTEKKLKKTAFVGEKIKETQPNILSEYAYMTLSDIIAEEIISLNDTKYDYSVFLAIMNIDKSVNFIINSGDAVLNYKSDLDYVNQFIDENDFVVFSKFNKKNNSINVKVIKGGNASGTLSVENIEEVIENEENSYDYNVSTGSIISSKYDNYGNKIENDVNSWVGEDSGNVEEENIKNISNIEDANVDRSSMGILNVNIDDTLELGNSNLKIVLVDDTFMLYNLYIYYRNGFNEIMYLPFGKYKINEVFNLNSEVQDLNSNLMEFTITADAPVELLITRKEIPALVENVEVATTSTISEIAPKKSIIPTILRYVLGLALIIGLCFGVKKFITYKFGNEN